MRKSFDKVVECRANQANFKDFGSKVKILSGSCGIFFRGFREINALFSGIKGAQTPLGASIKDLEI